MGEKTIIFKIYPWDSIPKWGDKSPQQIGTDS